MFVTIGQAVLNGCNKIANLFQAKSVQKEPIPLPANAVILADGVYSVPTQENCFFEGNNLVIGCAGSGKNRAYIMPNLMQMNCNYIVTDTKAENLKRFYPLFRENGYDIQVFSSCKEAVVVEKEGGTVETLQPLYYNPFTYISNSRDIQQLAEALTSFFDAEHCDVFWEQTLKYLFVALIDFTNETCDEDNRNFYYAKRILKNFFPDKNRIVFPEGYLTKIADFYKAHPEKIGAEAFSRLTHACTTETLRSTLLTAFIILDVLFPSESWGADPQSTIDEFDLKSFRAKKTALFIVLDPHRPADDICTLFLMQLSHILMNDQSPDAEPVHVILDEFQSFCVFDTKPLALAQSHNIMFSIIAQHLSQLGRQKHEIVDCCKNKLFLGGRDFETLRFFSDLGGAKVVNNRVKGSYLSTSRPCFVPDELAILPCKDVFVCSVGKESIICKKYDPEKHPNYKRLNQL